MLFTIRSLKFIKYCSLILPFSMFYLNGKNIMIRSMSTAKKLYYGRSFLQFSTSNNNGNNYERENFHLFIGNLPFSFTMAELCSLAKDRGINDFVEARIVVDKRSGRSRGFGYLDFDNLPNLNSAFKQLDGVAIEGRNLKVDISDGTDGPNRGRRKATTSKEFSAFFGNLHFSISNPDLESIVRSKIGEDRPVKARLVEVNGRSRGYGHMDFGSEDDMKAAIDAFDKVEILGRVLDVEVAKGSRSSNINGDENSNEFEDADDDEPAAPSRSTLLDPRRQGNSGRADTQWYGNERRDRPVGGNSPGERDRSPMRSGGGNSRSNSDSTPSPFSREPSRSSPRSSRGPAAAAGGGGGGRRGEGDRQSRKW